VKWRDTLRYPTNRGITGCKPMSHSIRAFIPGGTLCFTVALLERRRRLLTDNIDSLRNAVVV